MEIMAPTQKNKGMTLAKRRVQQFLLSTEAGICARAAFSAGVILLLLLSGFSDSNSKLSLSIIYPFGHLKSFFYKPPPKEQEQTIYEALNFDIEFLSQMAFDLIISIKNKGIQMNDSASKR